VDTIPFKSTKMRDEIRKADLPLRAKCLLRRPKQNLADHKNKSLFSQSKQSAGPRTTSHLPQCCCFYSPIILVLDFESWGLRWSEGPSGTVPTPVVHQRVINVCHSPPCLIHTVQMLWLCLMT